MSTRSSALGYRVDEVLEDRVDTPMAVDTPLMAEPTLTDAQHDCLRAVRDAGTVVLQRHGRIIGAGFPRFMPETFLRLLSLGYLEFHEPLCMGVTAAGMPHAAKGRPMMPMVP